MHNFTHIPILMTACHIWCTGTMSLQLIHCSVSEEVHHVRTGGWVILDRRCWNMLHRSPSSWDHLRINTYCTFQNRIQSSTVMECNTYLYGKYIYLFQVYFCYLFLISLLFMLACVFGGSSLIIPSMPYLSKQCRTSLNKVLPLLHSNYCLHYVSSLMCTC